MIEDTSFIIDVLRGDKDARARLDAIERNRTPEKVASITVLELYEGLAQIGLPADRTQAIMDVLDSKHIVDGTEDIMRTAGDLSGTLYATGEAIDREDYIIAATALRRDEPVLTRNGEHFSRVEGLEVATY